MSYICFYCLTCTHRRHGLCFPAAENTSQHTPALPRSQSGFSLSVPVFNHLHYLSLPCSPVVLQNVVCWIIRCQAFVRCLFTWLLILANLYFLNSLFLDISVCWCSGSVSDWWRLWIMFWTKNLKFYNLFLPAFMPFIYLSRVIFYHLKKKNI